MSIQTLALLSALGTFLCVGFNYAFGMCMTERPIVVGAVLGFILGDVPTGVTVGATLEVAFMGIVNIGGVAATDAAASTAVATAFAIYSGLSIDETVAVAIPIGLVANTVYNTVIQLASFGVPVLDKIVERGSQKGLIAYEFVMWILVFGVKPLVVLVGVLAGAEPVTQLLGNIPPVVSSALGSASGLLGAVGMAMLMRMLWNKEIAAFYFLGFVLVKYFETPTMGIAAVGTIIAVVVGMREMQLFNLEKKASASVSAGPAPLSEEEDFLS